MPLMLGTVCTRPAADSPRAACDRGRRRTSTMPTGALGLSAFSPSFGPVDTVKRGVALRPPVSTIVGCRGIFTDGVSGVVPLAVLLLGLGDRSLDGVGVRCVRNVAPPPRCRDAGLRESPRVRTGDVARPPDSVSVFLMFPLAASAAARRFVCASPCLLFVDIDPGCTAGTVVATALRWLALGVATEVPASRRGQYLDVDGWSLSPHLPHGTMPLCMLMVSGGVKFTTPGCRATDSRSRCQLRRM